MESSASHSSTKKDRSVLDAEVRCRVSRHAATTSIVRSAEAAAFVAACKCASSAYRVAGVGPTPPPAGKISEQSPGVQLPANGSSRTTRWAAVVSIAAFLVVFAAVAWAAVSTKGPTYDEPYHLAAGSTHLWLNDYRLDAADPPLWQEWDLLPVGRSMLHVDPSNEDWRMMAAEPWRQWRWCVDTLYRTPGNDARGHAAAVTRVRTGVRRRARRRRRRMGVATRRPGGRGRGGGALLSRPQLSRPRAAGEERRAVLSRLPRPVLGSLDLRPALDRLARVGTRSSQRRLSTASSIPAWP